ncbi:MAG: ATP synthase subunit I [Gammaproteobacteria bacterium]|nr:ATP synthase subunit I [Gammaproteobacteria bacterium]
MPDQGPVRGEGDRAIRMILVIQFLITAGAFLLLSMVAGAYAAWSAFAGGGISLATTFFFKWRVFAGSEGRSAQAIVNRFYAGEVQKICLTVVLFLIVIIGLRVSFLPMFVTYIVTLVAFWIVLLPALSGSQV